MNELFRRFSSRASELVGTPWAFILAVVTLLVWAATGPAFGFSDTWQLVVNTGTTIVTFLMVFLIQNTQNRDARAIHLKLDELLRAVSTARTGMVDLENCSDEELERLQQAFRRLREQHGAELDAEVAEALEEQEEAIEDLQERKRDQEGTRPLRKAA